MKVNKKIQVVMLATEDKESFIIKCIKAHSDRADITELINTDIEYEGRDIEELVDEGVLGELEYTLVSKYASRTYYKPQHLYFTSDDEIKEGDWCYNHYTPMVMKVSVGGKDWEENKKAFSKIIASSHPKLTTLVAGGGQGNAGMWRMLPQPSKAFLQKYCEEGGIDVIEVEYEDYDVSGCKTGTCKEDEPLMCWRDGCINPKLKYKPKVSSHNEITIHPIKNSWNKEEVAMLMHRTAEHVLIYSETDLEDWIKENL